MKHKRIFATALCGIMLLAGCGESAGDSGDSQSVSAEISSVESSSSTVESKPAPTDSSKESTTESSTSSSSVTQKKASVHLYEFFETSDTITLDHYQIDEKGNPCDYAEGFNKILVYESDYPDSPDRKVIREIKLHRGEASYGLDRITIRRPQTTKYYRIKYVGENVESNFSNALCYKGYLE